MADLVVIFRTHSDIEASIVRGLLETVTDQKDGPTTRDDRGRQDNASPQHVREQNAVTIIASPASLKQ